MNRKRVENKIARLHKSIEMYSVQLLEEFKKEEVSANIENLESKLQGAKDEPNYLRQKYEDKNQTKGEIYNENF